MIAIFLGSFVLILGAGQTALGAAGPEAMVKSVEVQIDVEGQVYQGLVDRIEYSVGRVGEKILLNQPLAVLRNNEATIRATIFNVFAKVLVGFQVETVTLEVGEHTKIGLRLLPQQPLINRIKVNLQIQKVTPELADFCRQIGSQVEEELSKIFIGLPVGSVAWSESIINIVVNYLMEREFPGFVSRFTMKADTNTELTLVLTPQDPVVEAVTVDYASDNIPAWFVRYKAKSYQDKFNLLKGVPVEFLEHYRTGLERYVAEYVNHFPDMQRLGLDVGLRLQPGTKTKVTLAVNSQYFHSKLEARYFANGTQSFGNFQVFLGYNTGSYEIFFRDYIGSNPGGNYKIGFQAPLGPNFTAAFEYELEKKYKNLWFQYHFERGDYLNLSFGLDGAPNEANIGIVINNNLNLEFVNYDRQFGIQFMFHF